MESIGLVLAGGGGKGAYQIGVWRALRELGLEDHVVAVSGTSVGALNAALFLKGDLDSAERIWSSISGSALLPLNLESDNAFFSNEGLEFFIRQALSLKDRSKVAACYATCKRLRDGEVQYHELRGIIDPNYRKQILMASAALPAVFPPVQINGELYVDGGANGDNIPVYPIYQNYVPIIIVVHLSPDDPPCSGKWPNSEIIDIFPSEDLGGFVTGVVDFDPERARWRRDVGYRDGKAQLAGLGRRMAAETSAPTQAAPAALPQKERSRRFERKLSRDAQSKKTDIDKEYAEMERIKFEQEAIQQQYEARIAQLQELARSPHLTTRVLWDATAAKYARTIETVRTLLQQDELQDDLTPRLEAQMRTFLDKCAKPEFHIALVGAIKAGKSSLINAILEAELASTEVTPETAALTKFRGNSEMDGVSISFYSSREWETLWQSASQAADSKFMEEYRTLNAEQEKDRWVDHAPSM